MFFPFLSTPKNHLSCQDRVFIENVECKDNNKFISRLQLFLIYGLRVLIINLKAGTLPKK